MDKQKKPYLKPTLQQHGRVQRLTLGREGSSNDGEGGGFGRRKQRGRGDNGRRP